MDPEGPFPFIFDQRIHHVCPKVQRRETPAFELYLQGQIREAFATLLTTKGLYQKIDVLLPNLKERCGIVAVGPAAPPPNRGPFFSPPKYPAGMTQADALREASNRVWDPMLPTKGTTYHSPYTGDSIPRAGAENAILQFYPPNFLAFCEAESCKTESLFGLQLVFWDRSGAFDPPRRTKSGTQQVWHLYYRCEKCHGFSNVITVKRIGLRLLVCGRSERLVPRIHKLVPDDLRLIMKDALDATNENDVYGGFYHLRTFVEHYMKAAIGEKPGAKIEGDDLCSRYNKTLDNRMKEGLPSLTPIYGDLSQRLHARDGETKEFNEALEKIHHHLEAKAMFGKYAVAPSPATTVDATPPSRSDR